MEATVNRQPARTVYGVWTTANDRTIAKDIDRLSRQYYGLVGKQPKSVLPFFVLSEGYVPQTGEFRLFIGGTVEGEKLEAYTIPEGDYAETVVTPMLGFIWGAAIGRTKRLFYTKWIPESGYTPLNMEYEYHTERSTGRKPSIVLRFAIRAREA